MIVPSTMLHKTGLLLLLAAACPLFPAEESGSIQARYTKYEYTIPMRDGVKLFTAVYTPKDTSTTYPMLLMRTPYGIKPYGIDAYPRDLGPGGQFAKDGFIFVYQDVRGRYMSEGKFVNVRPYIPNKRGSTDVDESSDAFDTIDWLLKHVPNHNGKVGIWGISYPGFYAAMAILDAHPALVAASPQAPITDWFIGDDFHHNGALYLAHAFGFFTGFGKEFSAPAPNAPSGVDVDVRDGYDFFLRLGPVNNTEKVHFRNQAPFWQDLMEHPVYDDFWKARDIRPHLKHIRPAVMTVGGWFDAEDLFGALELYQGIEKNNPQAYNILVMGPWAHGGWNGSDGDSLGNVQFHQKTAEFYREKIHFPFFAHFLKGKADPKLPEAYVFRTGRNEWTRSESWPPRNAQPRSLYLGAGGKLGFEPLPDGTAPFDEYVSDPARPVPFVPGIASGMTREHMTDDQRFASRRTDVPTYQTDVLAHDVTVAGPITPSLRVSTSGTDSDWVVKLIDVYPGNAASSPQARTQMAGYQQLVRGELMRGRFRNSYERPEPFTPGQATRVQYVMPGAFHTFRTGHRIMVQVQSSWFPLTDLNPQKFVEIYHAKPEDFQKATQRVYRSGADGSRVMVQILE
ncbi:MAG: CocE/NonD family hydrolase [Acidobacteria bacterium]|nr:CocE/NonD family hydrolase [Acidobacteriota bacterium]